MPKLNQDFTIAEQLIIKLFKPKTTFKFKGDDYTVEVCDKPRPKGGGECKTDVYIKAKSTSGMEKEWKISVKKENADFLENKMSLERAVEIFGSDAQSIIKNSISSIKDSFEKTPLICYKQYKRTEALSIALGWKFELMNKKSGDKSGELSLTDDQKIDVYAGTNLPTEKQNAVVNGIVIEKSGIANYYFEVEDTNKISSIDAQYIIDKLTDIESFAKKQKIYFACKALNYRLVPDKWDGDRPLSVYIKWEETGGKLSGTIIYDDPLSKKGNEIGENVNKILIKLGVLHTVTEAALKAIVDTTVKVHE